MAFCEQAPLRKEESPWLCMMERQAASHAPSLLSSTCSPWSCAEHWILSTSDSRVCICNRDLSPHVWWVFRTLPNGTLHKDVTLNTGDCRDLVLPWSSFPLQKSAPRGNSLCQNNWCCSPTSCSRLKRGSLAISLTESAHPPIVRCKFSLHPSEAYLKFYYDHIYHAQPNFP